MNKKAQLETFGMVLFFGAMIIFTIYCLFVYIPAIQTDMTNSDAVMNAIWWGLGCGIVGTIGLILAKR